MNRNDPFRFQEHEEIKGLYLINCKLFTDFRGDYKKVYEKKEYCAHGITQEFTETSDIVSARGVLRGLHYQTQDSQAKLVHVIKGKLFDVAVDLRPDSPTFGKWASFLLTEGDNRAVFIPEDFAHGFVALEDNTVFSYQCSGVYRPEYCGGIIWNDSELSIDWPLAKGEIILSEKDKKNIRLVDYKRSVSTGRKSPQMSGVHSQK